MEQDAVNSLVLDGSVDPAMSVWGLFMEADIVVQVVMLLLLLASFWSWAIIFEQVLRLRRPKERAGPFEEAFWSGGWLRSEGRRGGKGGGGHGRSGWLT